MRGEISQFLKKRSISNISPGLIFEILGYNILNEILILRYFETSNWPKKEYRKISNISPGLIFDFDLFFKKCEI